MNVCNDFLTQKAEVLCNVTCLSVCQSRHITQELALRIVENNITRKLRDPVSQKREETPIL